MKKLLLWAVVLATGLVTHASVWWTSSPGSATSGSGYSISAEASGGYYGGTEMYIYKNGSFFAYGNGYGWASAGDSTTDYGVQTVYYSVDAYFDDWSWSESNYTSVSITQPNTAPSISWSQNPGSAAVNAWFVIEAHGSDPDGNLTEVNVWREWSPYAFGGGGDGYNGYWGGATYEGGSGNVTFMAQAKDSTGATSEIIYHTINIYVPNVSPTVTWVNNPGSAWVNQWFNVQARGNDMNGNLAWVFVWKDGQPFAFNAASGGESYSDNNGAVSPAPGTVVFQAMSGDTNGADSGFIYHTVNIVNRAPVSPTVSSGGVTQINLGQSVTISGTLQDPDANLAYHNLYYAAPGGSWTGMLGGTPSGAGYSSLSTSYTPTSVGTWQFHSNGHDGYAWGPGATLSVTVVDATPPTVPSNPSSSANTTGNSFTFSWSASTDNVGVTVYEVMRDTTSLGTTSSLSMPVTGLAQATTYGMKVRAKDAAGNWSGWSSPILNVTTPDVTAPTIPAQGSFSVSGNTTGNSFTLNWTASTDNVGVTLYEVMRDTTSLGTTASFSMAVTGLTQITTYAMKVRARDAAGNWSAWSSPVYNVMTADVTAPSVPTGLSAPSPGNTSFTLSWTASTDNLGVTGYEVMRGSTSLGTATPTNRAVPNLALATTYAMKVRARDAAGNWSAWSAVLNVTTTALADVDSDGDGIFDLIEQQLGTNPNSQKVPDTNNDAQLKIHRPNP